MYVVSLGQGKIFRILPTGEGDTAVTADGTAVPSLPPDVIPPPIVDGQDQDEGEEKPELDQDEEEVADEDDDDGNDDEDDGNSDEDQEEDED
jgi:hypothetical protein